LLLREKSPCVLHRMNVAGPGVRLLNCKTNKHKTNSLKVQIPVEPDFYVLESFVYIFFGGAIVATNFEHLRPNYEVWCANCVVYIFKLLGTPG